MHSFFELPAHPLFVHAPLILLPLATLLAAVRFLVKRSWTGWDAAIAAGLVLCFVTTVLAKISGDDFGKVIAGLAPIRRHREFGDQTLVLIAIATVFGLATAVAARARGGVDRVAVSLTIARLATLAVAVVASIWMARTGHEGARLVWTGVLKQAGH